MQIRPTRVVVDLDALTHNLGVIRARAPQHPVCAVVKADAYGHGAVPVSRALERAGIDWLAVSLIEEGMTLRAAGIGSPILVLGGGLDQGYRELLEHGLTPTVFAAEHILGLAQAARGELVRVHLKIDTGMSRLGLADDELERILDVVAQHPNIVLDGVLTHLANANLDDRDTNQRQMTRFRAACARIAARGHSPRWLHAANSAALLTFADAHAGMVRPGLLLYGLNPLDDLVRLDARPVMSWLTRPVHVKNIPAGTRVSYGGRWTAERPSRIATLPVGYADGYPHGMSGSAQVLVRGVRVPVVGTICMDSCMIDVTDLPAVDTQDDVVLLGTQGHQTITAHELAAWAKTIPYEIVCGVGQRVPRHYTTRSDA